MCFQRSLKGAFATQSKLLQVWHPARPSTGKRLSPQIVEHVFGVKLVQRCSSTDLSGDFLGRYQCRVGVFFPDLLFCCTVAQAAWDLLAAEIQA